MRVLYVAYRMPAPPDKGERIRMYHQIRTLGTMGEVHLVCPVRPDDAERSLQEVREMCVSVSPVPDRAWAGAMREVSSLAAGRPRSRRTYASRTLIEAARRVCGSGRADIALGSTIYAAECVRRLPVPTVIDFMDVYSEVWRGRATSGPGPVRRLAGIEARRLTRWEAEIGRVSDAVIFASRAEADRYRARVPEARVSAIGNGVDLERYRPVERSLADGNPPTAAFTGTMSYGPNIEAVRFFADEVFPLVIARVPDARFLIVGRDPAPAVRALATPAITVTGTVADVRPYLARADVAVAPFPRAHGLPNKILEALASGLPVVATGAALDGIDARPDDALLRADGPAAFAAAVSDLLLHRDRARGLAPAARAYVEAHHRWEDHGARLGRVLEDALTRRETRSWP